MPATAEVTNEADELYRLGGVARKLLVAEQEHAQALEVAVDAAAAYCLAREQLHTARVTLDSARRKATAEEIPVKPVDGVCVRCARGDETGWAARKLIYRLQESTRGVW